MKTPTAIVIALLAAAAGAYGYHVLKLPKIDAAETTGQAPAEKKQEKPAN
jgi:hypothetical protein